MYWVSENGEYNVTYFDPDDVLHDVQNCISRLTPLQRCEANPAKTIGLDCKWLFELAAQDIDPRGLHPWDSQEVIVHITRQLAVQYFNLRAALVGFKRSIAKWESEGRMTRDLSGVHGYVFNLAGELQYYISPNGRVWPVTYLGKSTDARLATSPCTRAMLGIEHSLLMQAR